MFAGATWIPLRHRTAEARDGDRAYAARIFCEATTRPYLCFCSPASIAKRGSTNSSAIVTYVIRTLFQPDRDDVIRCRIGVEIAFMKDHPRDDAAAPGQRAPFKLRRQAMHAHRRGRILKPSAPGAALQFHRSFANAFPHRPVVEAQHRLRRTRRFGCCLAHRVFLSAIDDRHRLAGNV
jgi:hypothetical protein